MANTIRYDLIGAFKAGIKKHPQEDVKGMGMTVIKFEAVPVADCIIMEVESLVNTLPEYIAEVGVYFNKDVLSVDSKAINIKDLIKKKGKDYFLLISDLNAHSIHWELNTIRHIDKYTRVYGGKTSTLKLNDCIFQDSQYITIDGNEYFIIDVSNERVLMTKRPSL